jgi:Fur family iron response transcriptional regulator
MNMLGPDAAKALLDHAGVKPTAQRIEIARVLFARPQHLSADRILATLKAHGQDCSRATVYNTLGLFERRGLVRQIVVDPSRVFFDSTPGPHHHFYNVDTGEIFDVDADAVELTRTPPLPAGTEHAGTDVVMRVRNAR